MVASRSSRVPRPPERLNTVRVRLTMLAVLIVGIGLLAGSTLVVLFVERSLTANVDKLATARARATVAQLSISRLPATLPRAGEDEAVVQVVDRRGRVLSASADIRGLGPLTSSWPEKGTLTTTVRRAPFGERHDYRVVGLTTTLDGAAVAVYAANPLDVVSDGVTATATALAVTGPLLLLIVGITSWLLVGRSLRPVEAIRTQVDAITASELDRRVPEPAVLDELGRLARTMNAMLSRLERSHEEQRRFVSDASHELRSPLATMLAQLEIGLAHPTETEWVAAAQAIHREGIRLDQLVDQLLVLSSADSDAAPPAPEVVDLDELVLVEAEAVRARHQVDVDLPSFSAARLMGRPDQLRRVVRNLLDNAERHAKRAVTVQLRSTGDSAELVVSDDGEGIAPADRDRVFRRFVRLQPARERDRGGAGLGLAIVRDVVAGHGGRVWIADSATGAEVHVLLPLEARGTRTADIRSTNAD